MWFRYFINMVHYINWFWKITPIFYSWHKSHFGIVYNPPSVLLVLLINILLIFFCVHIEIYWLVFSFLYQCLSFPIVVGLEWFLTHRKSISSSTISGRIFFFYLFFSRRVHKALLLFALYIINKIRKCSHGRLIFVRF